MAKIALVTGGNKGLGFEVSKQLAALGHTVILTARDSIKGQEAVNKIQHEGKLVFHQLDTTDPKSIETCADFVKEKFGKLDILVNNAAILLDYHKTILNINLNNMKKTIDCNVFGPILVARALLPLMSNGRIVNVSSGMGQLSEMNGAMAPSYRLSKTALNAVTKMLAAEAQGTLVNSVCPGWCKTDMGGIAAERTAAMGAQGIVWAATLPDGGPTGGFFRDGKEIGW